ncbi:MAG: universal stress protein [Noviherbaspirillum sp.]
MFKKILVPTDGSPLSDKAVNAAIEFAKMAGAEVVAISVAEAYPFPPISESPYSGGSQAYEQHALALAQEHVDRVAAAAEAAQVQCEAIVVEGLNPYEEIVKAAAEYHCDAIFMASHGRKGLNKLFAGSETQKVLAHTMLPVLVFR